LQHYSFKKIVTGSNMQKSTGLKKEILAVSSSMLPYLQDEGIIPLLSLKTLMVFGLHLKMI
jgi:hypothetical protein